LTYTNQWIKALLQNGNVRAVAIQIKDLVQELGDAQKLSDVGYRGLGESMVSALMYASYVKEGERINLNIQGNGHYSQALVDAHPDGQVRGYVIEQNPKLISTEIPMGPWGEGVLSILKTREEEGEKPYIGATPLLTGHLAKDLTFYWLQSDQVRSALGIIVHVENKKVICATGFMIQALPNCDEQALDEIEKQIFEKDRIENELSKGGDPIHILTHLFQNIGFVILEKMEIKKFCKCSPERVERALLLVGKSELEDILKNEKQTTMHCDFCGVDYVFEEDKLKSLLAMY
jgi:molecular chaperone Hsp33